MNNHWRTPLFDLFDFSLKMNIEISKFDRQIFSSVYL